MHSVVCISETALENVICIYTLFCIAVGVGGALIIFIGNLEQLIVGRGLVDG